MHLDPIGDDYSYEEPSTPRDEATDSFADKIPYEMMGYASDRFTDDESDEDLVRLEDDEF